MNEDNTEKKAARGAKRPHVDADFVRALASLLEETGLTELEVEEDGVRVRVSRAAPAGTAATGAPVAAAPQPSASPQAGEAPVRGTVVTSPMVGTAYLSPQPGSPPFVKVGDMVSEGQTLLIIEAMKTMNHVPAGTSGRVAEIYVRDGQPVEFAEPLIRIE